MFKPSAQTMYSPTNTPKNKDNIVSLVINAKAIATRGGSIVRIPNLTALSSPAGHWSINQDKAKSNIKVTATISPHFALRFIFKSIFHTKILLIN